MSAASPAVAAWVDARAVVDPSAQLEQGVRVDAYAIVGPGVRLGAGCHLHAHAMVIGGAQLGPGNTLHAFAVLGGAPQQHRDHAAPGIPLVVGGFNDFREHVTVHNGTARATQVGSHCLLMAGAHIGHDACIANHVTLANCVQIAGHVEIEAYATFGGLSAVAQRLRVGESAFVAGGSMCERDVPPFVIVQGDRARVRTLNRVGLTRRGFSEQQLAQLRSVFRAFRAREQLAEAPREWAEHAVRLARALGVLGC